MFEETQNLKDTRNTKNSFLGTSLAIKDMSLTISYNKTNKLIAGLYMVTDILDKEEPIRLRLRILGAGVISDIFSFPSSSKELVSKTSEVLSFLDIASSIGIMSQMNSSILKKEFLLLQESIEEALQNSNTFDSQITLSEFMKNEDIETSKINKQNITSLGHINRTRLGVQKGHTLLKALSEVGMSNRKPNHINNESFDILKKERREQIIKIIKNNPNGTTITDIKTHAEGSLVSCGEKTLQRELISMVKDGVLNKTGEKRWSRYFFR